MNVPAISISGLKKSFGETLALKHINLQVEQGDFFALLGPNGAGKSTIISILSSLVQKTAGQVNIMGFDIDQSFTLAKQCLGVVPQEFNFNAFEKVWDIVLNQAGYYGIPRSVSEPRAAEYLKRLGLWEKRFQPSRSLSGGMKRRLMIVRALVHSPRVLILDEPTAGVDIELRRSMWEFLKEINANGTTIILTTHYLEEAEQLCRNVAIINRGEIIENTSVRSLLKRLNKEVFILDLDTVSHDSPEIEGYPTTMVDSSTLEVEVEKGCSLNPIFTTLAHQNINVVSMRNKSNRLEELFVSLVRQHES